MWEGVAEVLPFAIALAIVPVPVIAVIVILFSARARTNGPLFLAGWVAGLAAAAAVLYALAAASDAGTDETASDAVSWTKVVLGVVLLALAATTWRGRPAPGSAPKPPSWLAGVDRLGPAKAFGLGLALAAANPKNLILVAGAAGGLAQTGAAAGTAVVPLVVFVAVGSLSVAAPVVYSLAAGERAARQLTRARTWLVANSATVTTVLLLVFGVVLVVDGLFR